MAIKGSESLRDFIKRHEGYSATPYEDVTGKRTIGYGDTIGDTDREINETEASARLDSRVSMFEKELSDRITRDNLTPEQMDALIDHAYNNGTTSMVESGLIDKINNGQDEEVLNSLRQYTKARDKNTGNLVDFPGLVKRSSERAELYAKGLAPRSIDDALNDDFFQAAPAQEAPEIDPTTSVDEVFNDDFFADAPVDTMQRRGSTGLDLASGAASDEEARKMNDVQRLSKKMGISLKEAEAALIDSDYDSAVAEYEKPTLAEDYPATAQFGSNPNNYPALKRDVQGAKNIENAGRAYRPLLEDFKQALENNLYQGEEVMIQIGLAVGAINTQDGINSLKGINDLRAKNPYSTSIQSQLQQINAAQEEVAAKLGISFEQYQEILKMDVDSFDDLVPVFAKAWKGTAMSFDALMDFSSAVFKNREAVAILSTESAGSFVLPFITTAAGGAAGAVAPIPGGTALGAGAGAILGGGTLAFAQYMQEELSNFTDPKTGQIDYDGFYGDPALQAKIKKKAAVYGITMSLFDAVATKMAGKFLSKAVRPGVAPRSLVGKAGAVVKGLAKESASQAVVEGAQETVSRTAADVSTGELTVDRLANHVSEGLMEGVASIPLGGVVGIGGAAVRGAAPHAKTVLSKTIFRKNQVNESINEYNKAQDVRNAMNSSEARGEYPEQTQELVRDSVNGVEPRVDGPVPEQTEMDFDISADAIDAEIGEMNREEGQRATIPAMDWDKYHQVKGLDPQQAAEAFGPDIYADYIRARESNTSFMIPLDTWIRYTENDAEIDVIAHFNDSEFNALEADEIRANLEQRAPEIVEMLTPSDEEGGTIDNQGPPEGWDIIEPADATLDGEAGDVEIIQVEPDITPEDEDTLLRPLKLINKFRSLDEKKAYQSIRKGLARSLEGSEVAKEAIDEFAEFQFRHIRARAERTGIPLADLVKDRSYGKTNRSDAAGLFSYNTGTPHVTSIVFNKKYASLATVIHEFGHSWLHELGMDWDFIHGLKEEQMTPTQKEYKEAMQIAAQLFGMETLKPLVDVNGISIEQRKRVHETFAQTSEKYFLEGKFANLRIQKMMETFRRWMTAIASRVAKGYPQYPPLQINDQVERLFSILLDASNTIEEEVVPMFPEPMFPKEILGKDADRYIDAVRDAQDEAVGQVYSDMFNRELRERERLIDAALETIYERATQEVDELPSMKLLATFQNSYAAFKAGEIETDPRISFESFAAYIFSGDEETATEAKRFIPREMIGGKKKGGYDIKQVMAAAGVSDPEAFLNMMYEAGRRDEIIQQRADEMVDESFPAFKNPEQIHAIAEQAVNNKGKDKLLRMEMKILAERYLTDLKRLTEKAIMPAQMITKMAKGTIMAQAGKLVGEMSVRNFSPRRILRDSGRLGRDAAKLFVAGDILQAFDKKFQETVAFEGYRIGNHAQREIARVRAVIKRIGRYSDQQLANNYDVDVVAYARAVIQSVQAGQLNFPSMDISTFQNKDIIQNSHVEMLDAMKKEFLSRMAGRSPTDMSVDAFLFFGSYIQTIMNVAKNARTVEIDGRVERLDNFTNQLLEEIGDRKSNDPTGESAVRAYGLQVRSLFASLMTEEEWAKSGLAKLFDDVATGEANYNTDLLGAKAKIKKALIAAGRKSRSLQDATLPLIAGSPLVGFVDNLSDPIAAPELGIDVTFANKGELLKAILYMGTESGAEKLLLGGKEAGKAFSNYDFETKTVNEKPFWDMIQRLADDGVLNKEDFDALQVIWDEFAKPYEQAKAAMRYTNGTNMGFIEGRTIKTPFGDYQGKYIPVSSSRSYQTPKMMETAFNVDPDNRSSSALFPTSNIGMTKERQQVYYPVDLDMSNLTTQLGDLLRIAHLRKPMYDFGKVLGQPSVTSALEARRPGIMANNVIPWFKRVMAQEYVQRSDGKYGNLFDKIARPLRSNVYQMMFFGNIASAMKQVLGQFPAVGLLGGKQMLRANRKILLDRQAKMAEMMEKSSRMANRLRNQESNKIRSYEVLELNDNWLDRTREKSLELTFLPIQIMQTYQDLVIWHAGYEKAKTEMGLSESRAIAYADNAVERTQGSTNLTSTANVSFGSDTHKLFTMITSVPLAQFGLNYEALSREDTRGRKVKAYMSMALWTALLPALFGQMITEALKPSSGDEDDENWAQDYALRVASETADTMVPLIFRPVFDLVTFGEIQPSPALGAAGRATSGAHSAINSLKRGVELNSRETKALLDTFTLFTGVGTSILSRGVDFWERTKSESELRSERRQRRRQVQRARRQE